MYGLALKLYTSVGSLLTVSGTFTDEQVTSINNSLQTGIDNILGIFVKLLPVMAVITGIGFGIRFIMKRFREVKNQR